MTNEAFSRIKIDAQLRDQGWEITNSNAVRFEVVLPDRTKADDVFHQKVFNRSNESDMMA